MNLSSPDKYISLPHFQWNNIPPFAVVAGANGVGKTHLLHLLKSIILPDGAYKSRARMEPSPTRVAFLPAIWRLESASASTDMFKPVDDFVKFRRRAALTVSGNFYDSIESSILNLPFNAQDPILEALRTLGRNITHDDVFAHLPLYHFASNRFDNPLEPLSGIFLSYLNYINSSPQHVTSIAPWDRADQLLTSFGAKFRIVHPYDIRFPYTPQCRLLDTSEVIAPSELSSGEQAILTLVALIVMTEPRAAMETSLILLDEPDSHLHTSLIKDYLTHLKELTNDNVRVVMTTHRPETMLLCPEDSLFELCRDSSRIEMKSTPRDARPELVSRLAADAVAILPSARIVLVEDEDDRRFHQAAYELAFRRHDHGIPTNPRLAFMPVMAKNENEGDKRNQGASGGGGRNVVTARLEQLRKEGFLTVFRGLVDGDNRTEELPVGVQRLERYSIESYWADPIGLYEAAVRMGGATADKLIEHAGISLAEVNKLQTMEVKRLTMAADAVVSELEAHLPIDLPRERRTVRLHREQDAVELQYPEWLWTTTKKQIMDVVKKAFEQGIYSSWKKSLEVVGFVPSELIDVYRKLVTPRL